MDAPYLQPLDAASLRGLGVPEPWRFGLADLVRFTELDPLDHVNNAAYLSWFENLRLAYFKALGVGDYARVEERPHIVVRQVGIDYLAPLFLNEPYVLCGRTARLGTTSLRMDYAVFARGQVCTTSHAVIVWLDAAGHKAPIPDRVRDLLAARDAPEVG